MNIEITIKADDLAAAISSLAEAIKLRAKVATVDGAELTIPAGTPLTVTEVVPAQEPEKPKRKRVSKQAAEMLAESTQEAAVAQEAPQAAATPAEPEKPAEAQWEIVAEGPAAEAFAAEHAPVPTKDQIAAAGAKLLDASPDKMQPLLDLLRDNGVQAITQLKDDQLAGFADQLRALGAEV